MLVPKDLHPTTGAALILRDKATLQPSETALPDLEPYRKDQDSQVFVSEVQNQTLKGQR